jgi:ribonucleotide reductase beta subunit family protein with ferritin-like domain
MAHQSFTTTTRGLNRDLPPMRLYEKAKRLGIWNPSDINLSNDRQDWAKLSDDEKDLIWRLTAMFPAAIGVIGDAFAAYTVVPFGLVEEDFINFAMDQFSKRFERLEKAKSAPLDEINRVTKSVIDSGEA